MSMEVSKAAGAKSPVSFPSRAFKVNWELRGTLLSNTLPLQLTGEEMKDTQPCLADYTYIHTQVTLPHRPLSPPSWLSPRIFSLPCIWRGWQRWAHNLPMPKQRELDHPWADLPWSNASPICTQCCRGDRLGQTGDPCLAPRLHGVSASAAGQHDSLYKALSNGWLTCPRPSRHNIHTCSGKLPQRPDRWPYHNWLHNLPCCHLPYVTH